MKIFNWPWVRGNCHRKSTDDRKKVASTEMEYYHSPVEDASFNVGVLAIGTFGFDCHPITHLNQEQCGDYISINHDDDNDDQELEAKPLLIISKPITCSDFDESPDHNCDKIRSEKRITLADLLSADSDSADSSDDVVITTNKYYKSDNDDCFGKKHINVAKESGKKGIMFSLTITKKLNIPDHVKAKDKKKVHHKVMKLMTRMMKGKIHPDNEPDGNKNNIIAAGSS